VTGVTFALTEKGRPTIRYGELKKRVSAGANLIAVRSAVRALRDSKSMLVRGSGPNRRSAGSFFLNPIVDATTFERVSHACRVLGIDPQDIPHWSVAAGTKLAAAWLIEKAGYPKGYGHHRVGLSTHHTLAIVNRGGARASELIEFALTIRQGVFDAFGVRLEPEPRLLGFEVHPFADESL